MFYAKTASIWHMPTARAFRLHELHDPTAMVFDATGGGPTVNRAGQTRHNGANSGEEFIPCPDKVFPTTLHKPHCFQWL